MAPSNNELGIQMLNPGDLKIDRDYQRPLNESHVKRLMKGFSVMDVGLLTVSWRDDGLFYVLDGQHRREALVRLGMGDRPFPCLVYVGLTPHQEAELFTSQARAMRIHPVDLFRARVYAGDPVSKDVDRITTDAGYKIALGGKPIHIQGPKCLIDIYEEHGREQLIEVLDLVSQIYADDRHSVPTFVIGGVNAFLVRYGKSYDRARFIDVLSRVPKGKIDQTANSMKGFIKDKGVAIYGRAFLHLYNGKLRTGRLPDWEDGRAISNTERSLRGRDLAAMPDLQQET